MDYTTFIIGFLLGAICVFIPAYIINKTSAKINNDSQEAMKTAFENIANKIFQTTTDNLSTKTEKDFDEYFKRFKDSLEFFQKRSDEKFNAEAKFMTEFDVNIKNFIEAGNKISQDTSNLTSILKSDNRTQGKWGEIVLEKVLEASGLRKDNEYKIQTSMSEGRPDATIYLPEEKCIYIDAKTSLASWSNYIEAKTPEEKTLYLKEFINSTKSHISGLGKRDYSADEKSPDYVLMFIPIESCYSLMFCENCELWDLAWKNNIMPVSPSTLLAALKIINAFHTVNRQNKNAVEISRLCSGMLDKFANLLSDIKKSRSALDTGLAKLQGKGNILTQIEKIQELGINISKEIPELPDDLQIEKV